MKITVKKEGKSKSGMFIWAVWLVKGNDKLPMGFVRARKRPVAIKKAKIRVRKLIK